MDSPRGRIYLMRAAAEGRLDLSPTLARHLDLCLGCRACESACPAGVPFGSLLEATRAQLARRRLGSSASVLARLIYRLFPHPRRVGLALRAIRVCQSSGLQRLLRAPRLARWSPRLAAMASLAPSVPRGETLPSVIAARPLSGRRRGRVALLLGCAHRYLYPSVNRETARLLSLAGWDVMVPGRQGCCGALELHAGQLERLRERARQLAAVLGDADHVVTNSAGCGSAMKEYGHWVPELAEFAAKVRDVSELLVDAVLPLGPLETTVTYHDACHLAHGQRIRSQPRQLLARIPGVRLVPLAESELCCGSAGVYNLLEPDVAERLLEMKIARIIQTGAPIVVAGNPGCLLQIAKGCRQRGLAVEVVHPVELVARSVAAGGGGR
jgi:glycolate oxidase iron-sulfur subunit